jgi:hypothetical protein
VQDLDPGAFDEAEFDQAALEFGIGQGGASPFGHQTLDDADVAAPGAAEPDVPSLISVFVHSHLIFNRKPLGQAAGTKDLFTLERL